MFRVEFVCDNKQLPKALMALDGLCYNMSVAPVKDAIVKSGKVSEDQKPTAKQTVIAYLRTLPSGVQAIRKRILNWAVTEGHTVGAIQQAITILRKHKVLELVEPGLYNVNSAKLLEG